MTLIASFIISQRNDLFLIASFRPLLNALFSKAGYGNVQDLNDEAEEGTGEFFHIKKAVMKIITAF